MRLAIRSFGFLALAAASASAQDLTVISKVTHDGGPPETRTSYISSEHVRTIQGDGKEAILDLKAAQITTIDDKKKTYTVMTSKDLDDLAAKMKEQMNSPEMKKMQEKLNEASPEDRKRMEDAMGGMFAFDVKKTGTSRKIAGYACEDWTISIGQFSRTDECLTSDLKFPVPAWEMYRRFGESMKTMMAAFGPMAKNMEKMKEQFSKMKGYPMASTTTIDVMGHKSVVASEVVEVKRGPIPASAWEIPAGYTKVDNPMFKATAPRGKSRQ